jgi:hypothetical protein
MPTNLASKWPDRPWGTRIEEIGLSKKDSDLYPDYTLVDVEPLKGSPDLYWVFQKLDGPVWTTKSKGQDSLIPQKYRRLITTLRTEQEVDPDTEPDDLALDLIQSVVEQQNNTGKAVKVNTTETINTDEDPLTGQLLNRYATISDTSEELVLDSEDVEDDADVENYRTLKLSDTPLGNGKSVREKEVAQEFPLLTGYETDRRHNVSNKFTEQVVEAGEVLEEGFVPDPLIEYNPMDKLRTLKRTIDLGTSLDDWKLSYATRVSLDLPRELISVGVVWNQQHSIGTQDVAFQRITSGTNYSLTASASDAANSSASITADLQVKYKDFATGNLMGQRYVFFVKQEDATTVKILAKLNSILDPDANPGDPPVVEMWPVFMPVSETITVEGQSIRVVSNVSVGLNSTRSNNVIVSRGWETGSSDDFSLGLTSNSVQIPP